MDIGAVALSLTCTLEGASGAGSVPQKLLSSMKDMNGASATFVASAVGLVATTVVDGLTIVTQSAQTSPETNHDFSVTLQ